MKTPLPLLVAGCLISSATAQQPAIFVDFGSGAFGGGIPAPGYAAAAPMGGQWNDFDTDNLAGVDMLTSPALLDSNGAVTGVTLTYDSLGVGFLDLEFDEPSTTGDDQALIDDIAYVSGPSELRFDGLPGGTYDVFTYAMAPDSAAFITSVDIPGSANGIQDVGGDFAGGFVLGSTHAFHTVTVVAGQPLLVLLDVATTDDSLNGIQVLPSGGGSGLGVNYCGPANQNSGGLSARMLATGSRVVANNDLTVACADMPPLVFGFFIVSLQQNFVMNPAGSSGNLCLGGAIGRYIGPGQIQNSGTQGEISLALDLTAIPQPLGFVSAQSGDTWNWQTWFRDSSMGMPTSNFSDGLQIDFL